MRSRARDVPNSSRPGTHSKFRIPKSKLLNLTIVLLVLGLGFLVANARLAVEYVRFRRRRGAAVLVWPGAKPPYSGIALGIGVLASVAFGLGTRSQRYAMIVKDGTVQELLVEPGPGLNLSSAESVLSKL